MKGAISQIFSKARFGDDISLYTVEYRDMDQFLEISLSDFLERKETDDPIPEHRIQFIKRDGIVVYEKAEPAHVAGKLSNINMVLLGSSHRNSLRS